MKKLFTLLTIAVFATAAFGCEKNDDNASADEKATESSSDEKAESDEADEPAEEPAEEQAEAEEGDDSGPVALTAEGKEFDPAVEKSRIPDGAWICDMGTVHWAASEKPEDGKCPICGMQLKKHAKAGDSAK
mgnify:FL=1